MLWYILRWLMRFPQTPINTLHHHLSLTLVADGWWQQTKWMMNCTFRLKWGIDISNTSRSRWWSKHLTSVLLSNDKHSPSVPHNSLLKTPWFQQCKNSAARHSAFNDTHHKWKPGQKGASAFPQNKLQLWCSKYHSANELSCLVNIVFVSGSRTTNCPENTFQTDLGSVRQACWYFRVRQCLYSFACLSIKIKNDNLIKSSLQMEAWPWMLRHQSDMCIKRHRFTSSKEVMWQPASVCLTDCFQNKSKS